MNTLEDLRNLNGKLGILVYSTHLFRCEVHQLMYNNTRICTSIKGVYDYLPVARILKCVEDVGDNYSHELKELMKAIAIEELKVEMGHKSWVELSIEEHKAIHKAIMRREYK